MSVVNYKNLFNEKFLMIMQSTTLLFSLDESSGRINLLNKENIRIKLELERLKAEVMVGSLINKPSNDDPSRFIKVLQREMIKVINKMNEK